MTFSIDTGAEEGTFGIYSSMHRQINILGIPRTRLRTFTKYEPHIYGRPSRLKDEISKKK